MTGRVRLIGAGLIGAVVLALAAGCGSDSSSADASTPSAGVDGTAVTIADKGFTESQIVAQLYAQALDLNWAKQVGYEADTKACLGGAHYREALRGAIGVVTQVDRPGADVERARGLLREVGITGSIFPVSVVTGAGISELRDLLQGQIVSSKE